VALKVFRLIIIGFFMCVQASGVRADEPEKFDLIIVTGVGLTAESAKANAVRNAIEQTVGTYITSEVMVKNSELISDKILSYSGGFVKDTKVISQNMTTDGLFTLKIETFVFATKIRSKLDELKIKMKKIDGGSLFSEAVSRAQEQTTASPLLMDVFSKYPQAAYSFDIGKPQILSTDPNNNKAKVSIPVTMKFDETYLTKLKEVLQQVSNEELKNVELFSLFRSSISKDNLDKATICYARKLPLKSGLLDNCWTFNRVLLPNSAQGNFLFNNITISNFMYNYIFNNVQGQIIDRVKYALHNSDNTKKQNIQFDHNFRASQIKSTLDNSKNPPNILAIRQAAGTRTKAGGGAFAVILTDGSYELDKAIELDIDLLNSINSVGIVFDTINSKIN
jgi:hypothetical protein